MLLLLPSSPDLMLLWPLIILCHCLLVVETVKLLQSKQPTTLTIKLTTGFKDQMLMQARMAHAAGVVTDEVTTEKLVIVTGGEGTMAFCVTLLKYYSTVNGIRLKE